MIDEEENIENDFKDDNQVENKGKGKMDTKKMDTTKMERTKKTKTPESTIKSTKSKRTVKTPKGLGTVTRSAVAMAAEKVTKKRSTTKQNR